MAYRAISKAVALANAHTAYLAWLAKNPGERSAAYQAITNKKTGKDKISRTAGFIIPFGVNVASRVYLPREVLATSQSTATNSALAGAVASALNTTGATQRAFPGTASPYGTGGSASYELSVKKDFKFARVSVKQITTVATQKSNSRITNNLYQKNVTSTVTAPFGQIVGGETEAAAVEAITASESIATILASQTQKASIRFIAEGSK